MKREPEAWNARCLAGVLLLALIAVPLAADDGAVPGLSPTAAAEEPTEVATPVVTLAPSPEATLAPPAPSPAPGPVMVQPQVGPLSLSLGAQALLQLGDGWRWVDRAQLNPYLAASGRREGAWDLGLALSPGEEPQEFRVQFEPMGWVEDGAADALSPEPLMARLQDLAAQANARHRKQGQPELAINGWAQSPALEMEGQRLIWAEHRQVGGDDRLAWHGRLRLRGGVLKLDLMMAGDRWDVLGPQARALFEGLAAQPGQAWADHKAGDPKAPLDLGALVVDAVFGRGSLVGAGPEDGGEGMGLSAALWGGLGLALIAGALWAWRRIKAWRIQQMKDRLDEARLAQLEKDLGGRAEDVEEIVDEDEDAKQ